MYIQIPFDTHVFLDFTVLWPLMWIFRVRAEAKVEVFLQDKLSVSDLRLYHDIALRGQADFDAFHLIALLGWRKPFWPGGDVWDLILPDDLVLGAIACNTLQLSISPPRFHWWTFSAVQMTKMLFSKNTHLPSCRHLMDHPIIILTAC